MTLCPAILFQHICVHNRYLKKSHSIQIQSDYFRISTTPATVNCLIYITSMADNKYGSGHPSFLFNGSWQIQTFPQKGDNPRQRREWLLSNRCSPLGHASVHLCQYLGNIVAVKINHTWCKHTCTCILCYMNELPSPPTSVIHATCSIFYFYLWFTINKNA